MPAWRAPFPPADKQNSVQTVEINRGRAEKRELTAFEVWPSRVGFPFAAQGARLTRDIQLPGKAAKEPEIEFLLTSRSPEQLSAEQMLQADRKYWGIENGLHQRLDVIAGEDRSRVRNSNAALNLAVIRRAVVSVAVRWISRCQNKRKATMSGFYDFMAAQDAKVAFKLLTPCKPSWLPN